MKVVKEWSVTVAQNIQREPNISVRRKAWHRPKLIILVRDAETVSNVLSLCKGAQDYWGFWDGPALNNAACIKKWPPCAGACKTDNAS